MNLTTTGFESAADNMNFDRKLAAAPTVPIVRIYKWITPGITFPERRPGDSIHWNIDASDRPSGGGILFHSPGSIVFCIVAEMTDPAFPKPLKDKLKTVTHWLKSSLNKAGYSTQSYCTAPQPDDQNMGFCNTYHNPYELHFEGHKVAAIALRKWKNRMVAQGIIHTVSNVPYFSQLAPDIRPFLTEGLGGTMATADTIIPNLMSELTPCFGWTIPE
jgi:lipoate-protein ligase A